MEASGRHLEVEEGLFLPEPDRASLHDSEGLLNLHTTRCKGDQFSNIAFKPIELNQIFNLGLAS